VLVVVVTFDRKSFGNYFERCILLFGKRNEIFILFLPKLAYNFSRPYNVVIFFVERFLVLNLEQLKFNNLQEAFLDLYGIDYAKDASVAAHLELCSGANQWNVSFDRVAHD